MARMGWDFYLVKPLPDLCVTVAFGMGTLALVLRLLATRHIEELQVAEFVAEVEARRRALVSKAVGDALRFGQVMPVQLLPELQRQRGRLPRVLRERCVE